MGLFFDFGLYDSWMFMTVEKQQDGSLEMYRISLPQPGGDLLSRSELLTMWKK
jgi:hypothetical protein